MSFASAVFFPSYIFNSSHFFSSRFQFSFVGITNLSKDYALLLATGKQAVPRRQVTVVESGCGSSSILNSFSQTLICFNFFSFFFILSISACRIILFLVCFLFLAISPADVWCFSALFSATLHFHISVVHTCMYAYTHGVKYI